MAINLAKKYEKQTADAFYHDSVILGKTNTSYKWDGVKSIVIYTINTKAPGNYTRTGTARYGQATEVEDTIQEMVITQDKAVALTVDKGNNTEQMMVKEAGKVLRLEIREQFVPMQDKYALNKWATYSEKVGDVTYAVQSNVDASLTKNTIVSAINKGRTALVNKKVPLNNCYLYIKSSLYALLSEAPEFVNLEKLGTAATENGVVGKIKGFKTVEVADDYLQENVNFMIDNKDCVVSPTKIEDAKCHQDPPGISGHLLEVRWLFDAFVINTKANGVYVSKTA